MIRLLPGDCRDVLPTLEAGSVSEAAATPPEYLAGHRSGSASRDGEVSLLNATIRELAAEKMEILAAMRELLSGHDNLYRAHFGHLPACDPADDIAAKAARRILDEREWEREHDKPLESWASTV